MEDVHRNHACGIPRINLRMRFRGDPCVVHDMQCRCIGARMTMGEEAHGKINVFTGTEPGSCAEPWMESADVARTVTLNQHVIAMPESFEDGNRLCGTKW